MILQGATDHYFDGRLQYARRALMRLIVCVCSTRKVVTLLYERRVNFVVSQLGCTGNVVVPSRTVSTIDTPAGVHDGHVSHHHDTMETQYNAHPPIDVPYHVAEFYTNLDQHHRESSKLPAHATPIPPNIMPHTVHNDCTTRRPIT